MPRLDVRLARQTQQTALQGTRRDLSARLRQTKDVPFRSLQGSSITMLQNRTGVEGLGCPCCINCFDTLEAWNQHKGIHGIRNEKVENWSFRTMVRSLLHQHALDSHLA